MSIHLTDAGHQFLLDNDIAIGLHICVSWRPLPLRMWGDVAPGANWYDSLVDASLEAFRDEVSILQPWDVEFEQHRGAAASCERCVELCAQRNPQAPVKVIDGARETGRPDGSDEHQAVEAIWKGPSGEVSWGTDGLFFTAMVTEDNDWLLPLAKVVDNGIRYLASKLREDDLEFEEL